MAEKDDLAMAACSPELNLIWSLASETRPFIISLKVGKTYLFFLSQRIPRKLYWPKDWTKWMSSDFGVITVFNLWVPFLPKTEGLTLLWESPLTTSKCSDVFLELTVSITFKSWKSIKYFPKMANLYFSSRSELINFWYNLSMVMHSILSKAIL